MVYINGVSKVSLQYTVVVLKIFEEFVKEKPNTSRSLSVSFQKICNNNLDQNFQSKI